MLPTTLQVQSIVTSICMWVTAADAFRRIKAYRVPASLVPKQEKGGKKKSKSARDTAVEDGLLTSFDVFCNQAFRAFIHTCHAVLTYHVHAGSGALQLSSGPKCAFLATVYPEFDHIVANTFKEKAAAGKKARASIRAKQVL